MPSNSENAGERSTFAVPDELFQAVYDSPRSLPGEGVISETMLQNQGAFNSKVARKLVAKAKACNLFSSL